MKAFLLSIVLLALVSIGAALVLQTIDMSGSGGYAGASGSVRR